MSNDKLEKLKELGDLSISATEIADVKMAIIASTSPCQTCQVVLLH